MSEGNGRHPQNFGPLEKELVLLISCEQKNKMVNFTQTFCGEIVCGPKEFVFFVMLSCPQKGWQMCGLKKGVSHDLAGDEDVCNRKLWRNAIAIFGALLFSSLFVACLAHRNRSDFCDLRLPMPIADPRNRAISETRDSNDAL